MLADFKKFLLRGNVVDLAVGIVVGAAFTSVVNALVSDFLTPFISAIAKVPDLSGLYFTLNGSKFMYGHFVNALISFALVSVAVFFFVVKPINLLVERSRSKEPIDPTTKQCPECKSEIPVQATRCKFCAQTVA
jgi:large conductance mechanosensitive channel